MTYTAQPAWGSTADVADGLATRETTDNNKQRGRNGGNRRGAQ